jgi:hypothetical protein
MENNEQSTNNQRASELRAFKDLVKSAVLFLAVVVAIALLSMTIEQNTKDSEARCKSIQGEFGSMKCYKNGREI